jgi:hypothetical protein
MKTTTTARHCPACRRNRPVRVLGRIVLAGRHLDVIECMEETCALRWCVSARPDLRTVGAAA